MIAAETLSNAYQIHRRAAVQPPVVEKIVDFEEVCIIERKKTIETEERKSGERESEVQVQQK